MNQYIFEIKCEYSPEDVDRVLYPVITHIFGCAMDSAGVEFATIQHIAREYVVALTDVDFIVTDPIELIPHTLWGRVRHTLPMMLYRVHSFLSFFNERLDGSIVISDDFSTFEYRVDVSVGTPYIDMVKMAESILIAN